MIGKKINERLKELGMSQYRLAKEANLSRSYVSQLCSGQRGQRLPLNTVIRLSEPLKVPLDFFWPESGNGETANGD